METLVRNEAQSISGNLTPLKWPYIWNALRDLVPFTQFEKLEKHPWRSVTFSNVAGFKTPPWVFFKFFKLYKLYQMAQRITYINTGLWVQLTKYCTSAKSALGYQPPPPCQKDHPFLFHQPPPPPPTPSLNLQTVQALSCLGNSPYILVFLEPLINQVFQWIPILKFFILKPIPSFKSN